MRQGRRGRRHQQVGHLRPAVGRVQAVPLAPLELAVDLAPLVRADERLKEEFPLIKLPVLIMHGTIDKVTKPSGSQMFYDNAGSTDKTLKLYEGHAHDLLNDYGKEGVLADIRTWIEARLPTS